MKRRTFFSLASLGMVAAGANSASMAAAQNQRARPELIDTNVYLAQWPVRHSWARTPTVLVEKLRRHGIVSAWTGSFDGVLQTDIAGVNARLADACAREGGGILVPFGTVNPELPDWEEDVRRCHEIHRMPGLRVFPSYHGYTLASPSFVRLVELCAQRNLLLQIAPWIEDTLGQHPTLTASHAQLPPLADVLEQVPHTRVMLLNSGGHLLGAASAWLQRLIARGVVFEVAALENVAGIESVFGRYPHARLAFGSYAPFFYYESALLKLQESALSSDQLAAVRAGFAREILKRS